MLPVPSEGFINKQAHVDRGTVHYNGDGTGTASLRTTRIRQNAGLAGNFNVPEPISESLTTCNLIYNVNPDGSIATCNFTTVAGHNLGNTGIVKTRRQIVQGNTMLLHMPVDTPAVERPSQRQRQPT